MHNKDVQSHEKKKKKKRGSLNHTTSHLYCDFTTRRANGRQLPTLKTFWKSKSQGAREQKGKGWGLCGLNSPTVF
jgi:hypothetical protein